MNSSRANIENSRFGRPNNEKFKILPNLENSTFGLLNIENSRFSLPNLENARFGRLNLKKLKDLKV